MSINVSQAFHRTSANPIDDTLALTKAEMLLVNDNLMPSKYLTICQDDGYIYLYNKSATPSVTTGKFTKFEGGGSGGATALDDLTDVQLTSLQDGQALAWDDNESKWVNVNFPVYDTIQVSEMPTASASNVGKVVQYIGATSTYTHGYFYECASDGEVTPTYSWQQTNVQPSGGGSASLTSDVTSNTTVGAITSGTTLTSGTTFTEFVQKLLISEIAPTVAFSISKSGNQEYGQSYTETLTLTVGDMGTSKKIKTIAWYEGSTLLQTDTINSTVAGSWTYTMSTATTDTTTFKAVVTYTKSDDTDSTIEKTASITFYYNKFYGAVDSLTPDEATVEALTSALATSKGGTYSFTVTAGRICYAYPKSLGALANIKDGNGFSLFDSFTRTEQTYTQNDTSVDYYRYVLTDATTVSSYSVTFS